MKSQGSSSTLACSRLQGNEEGESLPENRVGTGERQNRRSSQYCFQRALASTTETVAKNVTFKINSHFFKLCRVYSTLLKMLMLMYLKRCSQALPFSLLVVFRWFAILLLAIIFRSSALIR